ncbi:hypothetical protein GE09DRAFT_437496 [Coniochaeta sp. 2T2.1]|nr:hypothetical protein GE09DRAFT_437496 [Coniochaeta sp. 2T2.1]
MAKVCRAMHVDLLASSWTEAEEESLDRATMANCLFHFQELPPFVGRSSGLLVSRFRRSFYSRTTDGKLATYLLVVAISGQHRTTGIRLLSHVEGPMAIFGVVSDVSCFFLTSSTPSNRSCTSITHGLGLTWCSSRTYTQYVVAAGYSGRAIIFEEAAATHWEKLEQASAASVLPLRVRSNRTGKEATPHTPQCSRSLARGRGRYLPVRGTSFYALQTALIPVPAF